MYGTVDLTWKPSVENPTPPQGKAPAIVRGDDYAHTYRFTDGVLQGLDEYDYAAQLRRARLTSATAGDPVAEFVIVTDTDGDDFLVTVGLPNAVTLGLPTDLFHDLQADAAGILSTLISGKAKVLDDVTRVEP